MPAWILFGLGAALMLGAANIPQKLAIGGLGEFTLSPFAYGILSGIVIIIINVTLLFYFKDDLQFFAKKEWGFALLAAILFAFGSVCIALGYRNGANASTFVALFNTNTLIATVLGLVLLKEFVGLTGFAIAKIIIGALLVIGGGILVTV
jgi:drug/metabolite transporter (DMT)-like permease